MKTYISLLRGINVSGQKQIAMPALAALYEKLGFNQVRTYIQSGNVVFRAAGLEGRIRAQIEAAIQAHFGFDVTVFLRSPEDIRRIVAANPFSNAEQFAKLHVIFLAETPSNRDLSSCAAGPEQWHAQDKEIYLFCPNGMGRAKLNHQYFERKLKTAATARNWNTIRQLLSMIGSKAEDAG